MLNEGYIIQYLIKLQRGINESRYKSKTERFYQIQNYAGEPDIYRIMKFELHSIIFNLFVWTGERVIP